MGFKSGFVAVVGRPNVGKSSLINLLAGDRISIISHRPQTTRNVVKAIVTDEKKQIVYLDTPGMIRPKNKLGEYMYNVASKSTEDVELILYMVEATDKYAGPGDKEIMGNLKNASSPVFLVVNKADLLENGESFDSSKFSEYLDFNEILEISALNGRGTDILLEKIIGYLPEGPMYFPDDMITDQPEKLIASEIIREKILGSLREEIPHGTAVEILSFKERSDKDILDIEANIYCEKESHKGIIIGKGGGMLKQVGTEARLDLEKFFAIKVNLKLWVKVKKDWRNSGHVLNTLGYKAGRTL